MKKETYGHDEGVSEAGGRVREMDGELDVVVVEPAAWDDGDAVETRHAGLREERGQDVADDTPNSVRSEDLKRGQALAHE